MAKSKSIRVREHRSGDRRGTGLQHVERAASEAAHSAYETEIDLTFAAAISHRPHGQLTEVVNAFLSAMRYQLKWRAHSWKATTDAQARAEVRP